MKTLKVEKNRVFIHHELSSRTCEDILNHSQSKLRFDLTYMDEDVNLKTWRGVIQMGESNLPILEIRDYDDDSRFEFALDPEDTVLDASTVALRQVWNYIEKNASLFPETESLPVIRY